MKTKHKTPTGNPHRFVDGMDIFPGKDAAPFGFDEFWARIDGMLAAVPDEPEKPRKRPGKADMAKR